MQDKPTLDNRLPRDVAVMLAEAYRCYKENGIETEQTFPETYMDGEERFYNQVDRTVSLILKKNDTSIHIIDHRANTIRAKADIEIRDIKDIQFIENEYSYLLISSGPFTLDFAVIPSE